MRQSLSCAVARLQETEKKNRLNVLCVTGKLWDEMTTNHFFGGWEGVCALRKKKKKEKKEGKTWRAECAWSEPCVASGCGRGSPPVWEEHWRLVQLRIESCNVSSSLFYWLQQLICYPLYKLCIYKYNTMVTFPYKTKVMHGLGNFLLFHF